MGDLIVIHEVCAAVYCQDRGPYRGDPEYNCFELTDKKKKSEAISLHPGVYKNRNDRYTFTKAIRQCQNNYSQLSNP